MKQLLLLAAGWRPTRLVALLGVVAATVADAQAQRFGPAAAYGVGGFYPYPVATGDVNGDGRPDIVTVSSAPPPPATASQVGVLLAQATGFAPVVNYPTAATGSSFSLALGDVTGDGQLDVVVANASSDNVSVLAGTGAGTFGLPATYSTGPSSKPGGVALGDLNGDGKLDIVTANGRSDRSVVEGFAAVLLGSGTGTFGAPTLYSAGAGTSPARVALADVNQDAVPDIILSETNTVAGVRVLLSQAGGGYAAAVGYPATGSLRSATAVAVGDINQDGYPDIVAAGAANSEVGLLLGQVGGTFGTFTTYPSGGNGPNGLILGDVTGDGRLDAVVTNFFSQTVAVLPGTSAGTFGPAVLFSTGSSTGAYGVALADFDRDGRLDITEANIYTNTVNVLRNQGTVLAASSPAAGLAGTTAALTGSPNPCNDQLQLAFSLMHTQAYSLAVYDGRGRLVRQLPGGTVPAGRAQQLTLPAHELAAGLYLVRLTTATDQQQLKFVKQ